MNSLSGISFFNVLSGSSIVCIGFVEFSIEKGVLLSRNIFSSVDENILKIANLIEYEIELYQRDLN